MEDPASKVFLAGEVRQERVGGAPGGENQVACVELACLLLGVENSQNPSAFGRVSMFGHQDLRLQAHERGDAKVVGVRFEVPVDDGCRDVLVLMDTEGLCVHREVGVLVGAMEVVALKARVQAVIGPRAAERRFRLQHCERPVGLRAVILLRRRQTIPS